MPLLESLKERKTMFSDNRMISATMLFLGLAVAFDGVRLIGKVPDGVKYRQYQLVDSSQTNNAVDVVRFSSYLGLRSVTFMMDKSEDKELIANSDANSPVYAAAFPEVTVMLKDGPDGKRGFLRAFNNPAEANVDNYQAITTISDRCLNALRAGFYCECISFGAIGLATLSILAYLVQLNRGKSPTALYFKLILLCFVVYLAAKITRILFEQIHLTGGEGGYSDINKNCLDNGFRDGGVQLIDNFMNLDRIRALSSNNPAKGDLSFRHEGLAYDSMIHFLWIDLTHIVLVVFLAWKYSAFKELLGALTMGDVQITGHISSERMMMMNAMENLIED